MNKIYIGALLKHPEGTIENSYLWIKEGLLIEFGEVNDLQPPPHGELLDYSGRTITADFQIVNGMPIAIHREADNALQFLLRKSEK